MLGGAWPSRAPRGGEEGNMTLTRKDFLRGALALTAGGAGWTACSSSTTPAGTSTATVATTTTAAGTGGATNASSASATTASTGTGAGGGSAATMCTTNIQANHPPPGQHLLTIPAADANAGAQKTYSIQGMADHDHTITITAAQMATLKAGGMVTVMSTTNLAHSHPVTVMCA
jgi:hypothetical protein